MKRDEMQIRFDERGLVPAVAQDAATGQVLLRERIRPGSEGSGKLHRFGSHGASRLRLEPADSREAQQPVAQFDQVRHKRLLAAETVSGLSV